MYFEDIAIGQALPTLSKGPMSVAHIMRWSASMENWHRIHYDWRFATTHDKLKDVLVAGSWKQHVLVQLLNDWVGESGWVWKMKFQFRGMTVAGTTLTAWGRVVDKELRRDFGIVEVDVGLKDQEGVESSPGSAVAVLQRRDGPRVPCPFDPRVLN